MSEPAAGTLSAARGQPIIAAMRALSCLLLSSMCLGSVLAQEPSDAADRTPSDFVRFIKEGAGGHLDTAITTYTKDGVELVLFGAVHIADLACYETLNDRFTQCDVLLYELVGPENYRPTKDRETGFNPIAMLQQGLKTSMELAFQLDAVDYAPANFVHADMTPEEFAASMEQRGESLLSLMVDMMLQGQKRQLEKLEEGAPPPEVPFDGDLVKAFRSGQGRHTLRLLFASQLEEMETLAAGGKEGSTLLEGRNEKCLEVLARELPKGHRRIGIYYGAAHLPHMERRLVQDLGWRKVGHEWLVAWDCAPRPDKKLDRDLVKLRQRCKAELGAIAKVLRPARIRHLADGKDGVASLADLLTGRNADGTAWYQGPTQDPWGQPYQIEARSTGRRWQVRSLGQDGTASTDDDLVAIEGR